MSLISKENIYTDVEGSTQEEVLHEIATIAETLGNVNSKETFFKQLCLREEESTTGFGKGVAIPHARHDCVIKAGIIVARLKNKVDWKAMDEQPVEVCICLIAPNDKDDFHLKSLSKLARKMIYDDFIELLKSADAETLVTELNAVLD